MQILSARFNKSSSSENSPDKKSPVKYDKNGKITTRSIIGDHQQERKG
jgi:hypothetical protein